MLAPRWPTPSPQPWEIGDFGTLERPRCPKGLSHSMDGDCFDKLGRMNLVGFGDEKKLATKASMWTTGVALAGLSASLLLSGCGTPGAPQPPSLKLPELVNNLTAIRAGNIVTLHWTMPKKTTDHLLIKGSVRVGICRREGKQSCQAAGEIAAIAGTDSQFSDTLPASLSAGEPRQLDYFVELKSSKGRSAGLSNPATVLAGGAPPAVVGLTAKVRADGVELHWSGNETTAVRLHRKLLNPPIPTDKRDNGPMQPETEPVLRDLLVDAPAAGQESSAIDHTANFGEVYEYSAQRVRQVTSNGPNGKKAIELDGEISAPIRVDVVDTFPPTVPQGLVAVLVPEEKTIDLSWQPDGDPYVDKDLAGYVVYRAEIGDRSAPVTWKRISGDKPLVGAAYRDASVETGRSYRYAVSAIDLTGHESKRSPEAQESVPHP